MGPILFIVFVNDLPDYMRTQRLNLYTDDTAISVSGASVLELEAKFSEVLQDTIK